MNKQITIGKFHSELGCKFRYYTRTNPNVHGADKAVEQLIHWKNWFLGIKFRTDLCVGMRDFSKPKNWKNNMAREYTLTLELLIIKFWITLDYGVMHLGE